MATRGLWLGCIGQGHSTGRSVRALELFSCTSKQHLQTMRKTTTISNKVRALSTSATGALSSSNTSISHDDRREFAREPPLKQLRQAPLASASGHARPAASWPPRSHLRTLVRARPAALIESLANFRAFLACQSFIACPACWAPCARNLSPARPISREIARAAWLQRPTARLCCANARHLASIWLCFFCCVEWFALHWLETKIWLIEERERERERKKGN